MPVIPESTRGPRPVRSLLLAVTALLLVAGLLFATRSSRKAPSGESGADVGPIGVSQAQTSTVTATAVVTATPVVTPTAGVTATVRATPAASETASASPTASATPTASPAPTATEAVESVFLPWGTRRAPGDWQPQRVWGMQFAMEADPARHAQNVAIELPRARAAGLGSIRTHIDWSEIEPDDRAPADYDWRATDRRLADYSRAGFDVIVSVVDYPAWAMVYRCGYGFQEPAERSALAWAEFIRAAASRYAAAPYRVAAWEIGNEVDAKTTVNDTDRARPPEWGGGEPAPPTGGCWGDRPEAFLEFHRIAWEEIKAVDPAVKVTFGNLAFTGIQGNFHRDFLDRFLALGGGAYFDYLGYHWFPDLKEIGFPDEPTGVEKAAELRAILAAYGLDKPLWLTETYRLSFEGDRESELAHVNLLARELPELMALADLERIYWYGWVDFPGQEAGYRQRGIIRPDHGPKLAFPLLAIARRYTEGSGREVSTEGARAWRFQVRGQPWTSTFAWSRDGAPTEIEIPAWAPYARVVRFDLQALREGRCCPEERVGSSSGRFRVTVDGTTTFIGPLEE
jgi:hypothetical protein